MLLLASHGVAAIVSAANQTGANAQNKNLVSNGGFEQDLRTWRNLWTREPGMGQLSVDRQVHHNGSAAARIEHRGTNDWSFEPDLRLSVQPGDVFDLRAWIKLEGEGSVTLCASTWDAEGHNCSWSEGERTISRTTDWKLVRTRFAVPPGVAQIQPRLIGFGRATAWLDDFSLTQLENPAGVGAKNLPVALSISNSSLQLSFYCSNATFSVHDLRTDRRWIQRSNRRDLIVTGARSTDREIEISLSHVPSTVDFTARLRLEASSPELTLELDGKGEIPGALAFPSPFVSQPGDWLVVPMNEGISYPVEDDSIETFRLIAYGGHGICMAFWGVADNAGRGYETIIETPDDAAIRLQRPNRLLAIGPEWDAQKGEFGYARKLRYIFFDQGGHVAMAKRYRQYARAKGLLKTLEQKRQQNPNVDLLVGAVNVWNWDSNPVELCREMQAAGIERILWSRGGSPDALRLLNGMKVLTSRYDIYQDVMDPANFPSLSWIHQDWPTAAWPKDLIMDAQGNWLHGWGVKGKEGKWFYCGVMCDKRALDYARERISKDLATHPYECRFIDTTTAAPWHECYSTNHPMTRTESREYKMKLLDCVSRQFKMVTGCETGHDASVPFLHYFEGMLSLGPYRVPDAGRDMQRIWTEVPEQVARFQLGQSYRLPLWELVYHDCVVAQWYWGDYNNKLPALWDKRDLFNVLYGTPPMFMFNRKLWGEQKERFVQSYRNTCAVARKCGYSKMTDHRFLTPDRNVQQTRFANGVVVTVNFGNTRFNMSPGKTLQPMAFVAEGM
jgi:hypothetical protein